MARNSFAFDGGDYLTTIGATWFVSYSYHKKIDSFHTNWRNVSTWESRASTFQHSVQYHEQWLKQIITMDDSRLNTNRLGLKAGQIKQMAEELLSKR